MRKTLLAALLVVSTSAVAGGYRPYYGGYYGNGGCYGSNCAWALAGAGLVGVFAGAMIASSRNPTPVVVAPAYPMPQPIVSPTVVVPPPVVVERPVPVPQSPEARLRELQALFAQGLITPDEFQRMRNRVLREM